MQIKRSVRFILHVRKRGGDEAAPVAVRLRVAFGGKTKDFSTGVHVAPSSWVRETETAKGDGAADVNRVLAEQRAAMEDVFARFELIEKRVPTIDEVAAAYVAAVGKSKKSEQISDDVGTMIDKFCTSQGQQHQWNFPTYQKFRNLKRLLLLFRPSLRLSEIDDDVCTAYMSFLLRQGKCNTTVAKNLSFLRWFLRWCAANGYYQGHSHDTFRPRLKGTTPDSKEVIYCTADELAKLEAFVPSAKNAYLTKVRDVFLFCCFSGLRYSDVAKLCKSDIKDGYMLVVTKKTTDALRIELNKYTRAILAKYADVDFPNGNALPVISNVKMNAYLKELGIACGLTEPTRIIHFEGTRRIEEVLPKYALLTTHCARRTFVVNALRLGIASEVIMRWTGHSDYKAMRPYVKIVDDLKRREMDKFDQM